MFLHEAKSLAKLNKSKVIEIIDADIFNETPIIILEYLKGSSLSQIISKTKKLSLERILDLMEEIGSVLKLQEEKGILHLDIKPSNIFQRTNGNFCLCDYGLAGIKPDYFNFKTAGVNQLPIHFRNNWFGTPNYMAPEQAMGLADHRSDLFSLGITLFESILGKNPRAVNQDFIVERDVSIPLDSVKSYSSDITDEIDIIISSLTQINSENRYQSSVDFLQDVYSYRYNNKTPFGSCLGTAFIAMPFSDVFVKVYHILEDSSRSLKLKAKRLDKEPFIKNIWDQCLYEIELSRMVIADFSSVDSEKLPNPNVVTEAAHARAIGKPLILISQDSAEDLPFDWKYMPVISYNLSIRGLNNLKENLIRRVRQILYLS